MERQQDNIGWRKQCSVFPPPIAHHCVSGVSVLHLALLYPGSVSQRIPVSHVRRWIPVIFSPADFEQLPTRAGFLRYMYISTPSARGSCLKICPPHKYFISIQVGGALFNDLMFILRLLSSCFGNAQLSILLLQSFSTVSTILQGWISGEWGSVSTLAPIVVTRR